VLYTTSTADLPTTNDDDTSIIATSNDPRIATNLIQEELGLIEAWIKKWRIASKRTKISASDILVH